MNVLIAMDSLKGSLTSIEANEAILMGIKKSIPVCEVQTIPMADGGEGTVDALVLATGGEFVDVWVTGPVGEKVKARYGILGGGSGKAVIEVAQTCGLPLLKKEQLNPLSTTTFGVGEMILDAMNKGCKEVIVGLGGSATNDAGVGMLQALGYRFLDRNGDEVGYGGGQLSEIVEVVTDEIHPDLATLRIQVACDVTNPLYGETGAAFVYGPQKGATPEMVEKLDQGLRNFAQVVVEQFGVDLQEIQGSGAAGGLGAAFSGILNAELQSGVDLILRYTQFEKVLSQTNLVITGEGKIDGQTSMGKGPAGIASLAKKHDIPVVVLAGDVSEGNQRLHDIGITAYFTIVTGPTTLAEAMNPEVTRTNLQQTAEQIGNLLQLIQRTNQGLGE